MFLLMINPSGFHLFIRLGNECFLFCTGHFAQKSLDHFIPGVAVGGLPGGGADLVLVGMIAVEVGDIILDLLGITGLQDDGIVQVNGVVLP